MHSKNLIMTAATILVTAIANAGADTAPNVLPASAVTALRENLSAATRHDSHVWRDTSPTNTNGTITAYVEIARGDRRKWEFDMARGIRTIDRMIPEDVGGYPVNYGFVPQTVSYDGDPFDALVLGPAIDGGRLIRGIPVGLMLMEDEKGLDSKVVLSPADAAGRPRYELTAMLQREIGDYFSRYKQHQPGAFSRVPGWGPAKEGVDLVLLTNAFFLECRASTRGTCEVKGR